MPSVTRRPTERVERLLRECAGDQAGLLAAPLSALIANAAYDRPLALELEAIARDRAVLWAFRRIAALMLETALSRIGAAAGAERRFWLERFGMTDRAELAREGYIPDSSLATQVWRRLGRYRRIHRLAEAARRSDRALRDFLYASHRECRLTFARYLFAVDEVIARIEQDVRRSGGQRDIGRYGEYTPERRRTIDNLPAMERAIFEQLARGAVMRWAAPQTSSRFNALVEYPLGTVVLTVKPPGSSHEFEIKRAGRPRELPLDVIWARNGWILPSSHHLDGGSMHHLLAFEGENAAFFSRVFREVHGFDASMSRTLALATIYTIPTPNGPRDVLDYFTDRSVFGERYDEMRWNLQNVVKTMTEYAGETFEPPMNDIALTLDFLGRVKPAQAIQVGTTTFRLDRVTRYLSPSGADRYLRQELGGTFEPEEARRFADEMLDEVLGEYEPPEVKWRSHAQYVEAAFAVPANRSRANRTYISNLEQIGRFWGTLLGIRGHTEGESFVERNAGLRSVWQDGEWKVRVVFMDHDSLSFASVGTNYYRPAHSIANAAKDAKHVLGGRYGKSFRVRGELWFMKEIYRVSPAVERRGITAFRKAMKSAYDRTHEAIRTNPDVSRMFRTPFIEKLSDWDELVSSYLKTPKNRSARNAWREASHAMLTSRGYQKEIAEEHVTTVTSQVRFLRRVSFLF